MRTQDTKLKDFLQSLKDKNGYIIEQQEKLYNNKLYHNAMSKLNVIILEVII